MKKALKETQRACADLYVFEAVASILESSCAPSNAHHQAAQRIIGICKADVQRALTRMDRAGDQLLAAAEARQPKNRQTQPRPTGHKES